MESDGSGDVSTRTPSMPSLEKYPLDVHDELRWSAGLTPIKVPRSASRTMLLDRDGHHHELPNVRSIVRHFEELEAVNLDYDIPARRHASQRAIFTWAASTPPTSPSSSPTMRPRSQSAVVAPYPMLAALSSISETSPRPRHRSHTISIGSWGPREPRDALRLVSPPRFAGALHASPEPPFPADDIPIVQPPGSPEIAPLSPPDVASPDPLSPRRIKAAHNFENEEIGAALSLLQVDRIRYGPDVDELFKRCKEQLFELFEALGNVDKAMRKDIPALMLHASARLRKSCQALFGSVRRVLKASDDGLRQAHVYKHSIVMLKQNLTELKDELGQTYNDVLAFWSGPSDAESRHYAENGRQICEDLGIEMDMLSKLL
eukprot:TRINITY_DN14569_c0_g1_i1.p1 TRINITY_DN14569_c0_g1~~TRINITY_DN14569_c0_g1_i1.p1  ORF type:complete len:375 (+),score=101.72 TRINITY_DN14569_c0_g1_i1:199-1323(+)